MFAGFLASEFLSDWTQTQYQWQCQCRRKGEGWEGYAAAYEAGLLFKCKQLQRGWVISSEFQLYKTRYSLRNAPINAEIVFSAGFKEHKKTKHQRI